MHMAFLTLASDRSKKSVGPLYAALCARGPDECRIGLPVTGFRKTLPNADAAREKINALLHETPAAQALSA